MTETAEQDLGPIATKVIYEDSEVRIWDQIIEPGAVLGAHKHENDYVLVDVKGTEVAVDFLPGNEGDHDGHIDLPVRRGNSIFVRKGAVETAKNAGTDTVRYILIELLNERPKA